MNSSMVINYARKGTGFKGWYLNKTLSGKIILRTALAHKFGNRRKTLENGVAKYEKKAGDSLETRYISDKFKPFISKSTEYNDDGAKVSQAIYYQHPDDMRHRTSMIMRDYPKYGKRVYNFGKYSYNEETKGWNLDYREQTTVKYNETEVKAKSVIYDYIAKTRDILEKTITRKSKNDNCQ